MNSNKNSFIKGLLSNWDNFYDNEKRNKFYEEKLFFLNSNLKHLVKHLNENKIETIEELNHSWKSYIQNLFLNHYNFIYELLALKINKFFHENKRGELNLNEKFLNLIDSEKNNIFLIEKSIYVLCLILREIWKDLNNRIDSFIDNKYIPWLNIRNFMSSAHSFNYLDNSVLIDDINYDIVFEIKEMNLLINEIFNNQIYLEGVITETNQTILLSDYFKPCQKIIDFITESNKIASNKKIFDDKQNKYILYEYKNTYFSSNKNDSYLNFIYIYLILNTDNFYNNQNIIQYWIKEISDKNIYEILLNSLLYSHSNNRKNLVFFRKDLDAKRIFNFINQILEYGDSIQKNKKYFFKNKNKNNFFISLKNYFFSNNNESFFNSSLDLSRPETYDFSWANAFFTSDLLNYFLLNYFKNKLTEKSIFNELFNFYKNIFVKKGKKYFNFIPFNLWIFEKKLKNIIVEKIFIDNNYFNVLEYIYYNLVEEKYFWILDNRFSKEKNKNINYLEFFPDFFFYKEVCISENTNIESSYGVIIQDIKKRLKMEKNIKLKEKNNNLLITFLQFYYNENIDNIINEYELFLRIKICWNWINLRNINEKIKIWEE